MGLTSNIENLETLLRRIQTIANKILVYLTLSIILLLNPCQKLMQIIQLTIQDKLYTTSMP